MPPSAQWQGSINRPDAIYVVKAGDTLSTIAKTFYNSATDYQRIADANSLKPDQPIKVGQRLRIPGGGSSDPKSANDSPDIAARKATTVQPEAQPVAKVTPGFTALDLHDWRVWAGGGLVLAALYFMLKGKRARN